MVFIMDNKIKHSSVNDVINEDIIKKFNNLVDKKDDDECWLWKGMKDHKNYGLLNCRGRYELAHILSYIINTGYLEEGKEVCHSCDNPLCVNPKHLFIGTHKDNMKDKKNKGRSIIKSKYLKDKILKGKTNKLYLTWVNKRNVIIEK